AQDAKDKTAEAIKNEQEYMNEVDNMVDKYMNGIGNGEGTDTPTGPEEVPVENIKSDWAKIEKIAEEIAKDDIITSDTEKVTVILDNKKYSISTGDLFEVGYEGEVRRVRVLGFKHDDLVDQTVYGGTHEKASISFEFVDFMAGSTYKSMNGDDTNSGGWANTTMRTFLNGEEGKEKLSNKAYIKQVKKKYIEIYDNASSVTTCNDYLWLLAASEVVNNGYNGSGTFGYAITSEGSQYKYYQGVTEVWNTNSTNRVKKINFSGSAGWWWLRSPSYDSSSTFCDFDSYGNSSNGGASRNIGVAPGFCI
ncbi:MAG: hypothetical protein HFJ32_05045, partial [Clostridia bacterium]|nr:hypothetical protein [Clostridia bacterium]